MYVKQAVRIVRGFRPSFDLSQLGFLCRLSVNTVILLLLASPVLALPQFDNNKHLGVASCASSVCHGKSKPVDNENVWLNEYRIWTKEDRHSRAYKTLLSKESERIAQNLGLANAHNAKICLDCHADNIAKSRRGPKFQISDGVGCEGCHGGSEQWIESHTEKNVKHADNLARGMYATENGVARAKLCLSCHLGTNEKLTTHKIMGAGHPRMSFELETFTANQPAHYAIDKDYKQRKGRFIGLSLWIVGQLEMTKSTLALMQTYLISQDNMVPELYFYDCHACHHPMSDLRWTPTLAKVGMPPGAIRINDANFLMLIELTAVVAPAKSIELKQAVINLHIASVKKKSELKGALIELSSLIANIAPVLTKSSFSVEQSKRLRARLLQQAAAGEYRDFSAAEQAFLAIDGITLSLEQGKRLEKQLDSLYNTLSDQDRFKPQKFKAVAETIKSVFN